MITSSTWSPSTKQVLVKETETLKYDKDGNVVERTVEKEYESVPNTDLNKYVYPQYPQPTFPYTINY